MTLQEPVVPTGSRKENPTRFTGNPQYSIWPYSVVSGRCHGLQNR